MKGFFFALLFHPLFSPNPSLGPPHLPIIIIAMSTSSSMPSSFPFESITLPSSQSSASSSSDGIASGGWVSWMNPTESEATTTASATKDSSTHSSSHHPTYLTPVPTSSIPVTPSLSSSLSHRTSFDQPVGVLLSTHLAVVQQLANNVATFKQQLRHLIGSLAKMTDPPTADNPAPTGPPANPTKEVRDRMIALFHTHSAIQTPLMSQQDKLSINGRPVTKKEMFDMLDGRYNSASLDFLAPANPSARLSDPNYVMNGEVFSGDLEGNGAAALSRYRYATSTLNVNRPYLEDGEEEKTMKDDSASLLSQTIDTSNADDDDLDTAATASVRMTPTAAQLLTDASRTFQHHSAILLNLVQSSGLNTFDDIQKRIRTECRLSDELTSQILPSPSLAVPSSTSSSSSSLSASSSLSSFRDPFGSLDAALLHYLAVQHSSWSPMIRSIEVRYGEDIRRQRELQLKLTPTPTPAQIDLNLRLTIPKPTLPQLPFIRKIFATRTLASPYAPTVHTSHTSSSSPPSAILDGIIFTLPNILHAYIQFDSDSSSASASASSDSVDITRVSIVAPSELNQLVDGFTLSQSHTYRSIQAQATNRLWRLKEECITQNINNKNYKIEEEKTSNKMNHTNTNSTMDDSFHPTWKVLHQFMVSTVTDRIKRRYEWDMARFARTPQTQSLTCEYFFAYHPLFFLSLLAPLSVSLSLSLIQLYLSSYWDLHSRPCQVCKLHLAPVGANVLASANIHSVSCQPTLMMEPTVRFATKNQIQPQPHQQQGGETVYVPLHTGCVELFRQT